MRVLRLLFLLPLVLATPVPDQDAADEVDAAYVTGIVESLFGREGRDMDDEEDVENALEEGEEEQKSMSNLVKETNPVEIERFNAYMDAIYRRMNAALRAKLMDPMELNLNKKDDKKEKRTAKALEEEEEDTEDVEVDRMGKAEDKMNKKNKKTKRKLSAEERAAKKAERKSQNKKDKEQKKEKTPAKKGKKSNKGKNKKNNKGNKKNNKGKGKKKEDVEEKEEVGLAREKRNNDKKHNNKKANGASKGDNHHGKHGKGKKGSKGHNKNGKKAARTNDVSKGKTMGALSGIATLRRSGDVEVMNAEGHVIVKSEFSVGPLQLEVSKSNGNGKDRSVKTAKAITEKLAGKMILKVKTDGSAHVKTVVFQKPEGVNVQGSLGGKQARSDKYLENSLKSIRPVAAQRVLKMARYVLKSPSTVERS